MPSLERDSELLNSSLVADPEVTAMPVRHGTFLASQDFSF